MKNASLLHFAFGLLLAAVSASTLAATATIITEINALFDPNGTTSMLGCVGRPDCDRNLVIDAPLVVGDPDGVSAASNVNYAFFASTNTSIVPNFIHTGAAQAHASPGSLHASAEAQLTGTGGGIHPGGISANAYVEVTDQIKVNSSSLAKGTIVTLNVLLDITGHGRGRAGIIVSGRKAGIFGLAGLFGGDEISSREADSLPVISGQFSAEVGSTPPSTSSTTCDQAPVSLALLGRR